MKYVNIPEFRMGLGVMVWIIMIVLSQESMATENPASITAAIIAGSAPNP
ncbi:MAG: hypothetical protein VW519_10345 [Luminiphilus sp.]